MTPRACCNDNIQCEEPIFGAPAAHGTAAAATTHGAAARPSRQPLGPQLTMGALQPKVRRTVAAVRGFEQPLRPTV